MEFLEGFDLEARNNQLTVGGSLQTAIGNRINIPYDARAKA